MRRVRHVAFRRAPLIGAHLPGDFVMSGKSRSSTTPSDMNAESTDQPTPTGQPTPTTSAGGIATIADPCAVAGTSLAPLLVPDPSVIDSTRVEVAGSLMSTYIYGMRLRFFAAVDRARELFDTQELCVDSDGLRNTLYCWPDRFDRVSPPQRATLVARVLGQSHPDVPDELVDTQIEGLLRNVFDLINSVCDPGLCRTDPTPATLDALELARESARYRLSQTVTEMVAMQVRDLSGQLDAAATLLARLAPQLSSPCRTADIWASVDALVGPQLRADKIDVVSVAHAAQAWQAIFNWLAVDIPDVGLLASVRPLCGAVSRLRPPRQTGGCACTNMALTAAP
jgi:hypothetical protein